MSNKELIYIGKRSLLLKSIFNSLPSGEIISFQDALNLHKKDGLKENKLVLFSLPEKNNVYLYFDFIKNVKCIFLINISSTCIYSENYYDESFFKKIPKYVFIKFKAHKLVNKGYNRKNLIVGILDKKAPFPSYPFSKLKKIAKDLTLLINNFAEIDKNSIFSFEIIRPKLKKYRFIPYNVRLILRQFPLASHYF